MSKLLTEPRLPKDIVAPKRFRKKTKKAIEGSDEPKITHKILKQEPNGKVQQLFDLYKEDKFKARVKYFNDPHGYAFTRLVYFQKGDKDFVINDFTTTFGISVTGKIYSSQKKTRAITYKNGRFYYLESQGKKNGIRPLTFASLLKFIQFSEGYYGDSSHANLKLNSQVYQLLYEKFPFLRMLSETEAAKGIALNTVVTKKLFSQKDLLRHIFKVPMNVIDIVCKTPASMYKSYDDRHYLRQTNRRATNLFQALLNWKQYNRVLDNVQNLTPELYHSYMFGDTCNMANTLGRKVNCAWGEKKLKEVHDEWARDIRNILLDCEKEYKLKIKPEFVAFADFSGYNMLFTNKQMLVEGMSQNHCVGTYIDRVQRGECAIYHVEGYTLQVVLRKFVAGNELGKVTAALNAFNDNIPEAVKDILLKEAKEKFGATARPIVMLENAQFRGKHNSNPPQELVQKVNAKLAEFSATPEFIALCGEVGSSEDVERKKQLELKWAAEKYYADYQIQSMSMDEKKKAIEVNGGIEAFDLLLPVPDENLPF